MDGDIMGLPSVFTATLEKAGKADEHMRAIMDALKELRDTDVLVGIPEENAGRDDGGPVTNVDLLYIHSNGSPLNNLPARPVLEPAMTANAERLSRLLDRAADAAMDGNVQGMRNALETAGMAGQNAARDWFTDPRNGWPPLKAGAISTRERKMSKASLKKMKQRQAEDSAFVAHRPLIDTGELRKSITYVIRKK